ncbi:T9SS type A sorting domain-containing protein [Marivirga arenosa]|uniref:T9SS type A sorting domain-containing protein n=1 Tax=Marivirga arenosa TaxID=3059076 RepID=A0AA51X4T0_9BACT|nr:T9SS type A sorting domain-containing protein [Marivirga sp. BKB1-2]WNB17205.1 T9SS type A sorting domain-containing protein [Marivirga sp. BKB1-2]
MKHNFTNYLTGSSLLVLLILFLSTQFNSPKTFDTNSSEGSEIWSTKKTKIKSGKDEYMKPDGFIEYFNSISSKFGEGSNSYKPGYRFNELKSALNKAKSIRSSSSYNAVFKSRGPGNVGGRTRAIAVDPDDNTNCTWIAGAASGGIWKTTDCGQSWINISPNIPNLSTNSIAQSPSNPDVIYVGTGEVFAANATFVRGDGIYKSINRGESWDLLVSTVGNNNFESVNRISIDPTDENVVIIATNSGIFKSIDGGNSWVKKYESIVPNTNAFNSVQDLQVDPTNFDIQYAGVNSVGIVKSMDGGETWELTSEGITDGTRFEIAIAPSKTDVIYTSTEVGQTTFLYYSGDAGASWYQVEDEDSNTDYLGGQGWYDNSIAVNPYDETEVFVGGVNIGKYVVDGQNIQESERQFLGLEFENIEFLSFVNFGADFSNGILNIATGNLSPSENPVTVEIRFGGNNTQKAHRFSVPADGGANGDGGAGIPETQYNFEDYSDVPFEVWDVENNRQLMVSYRDQKNDGTFNLNPRDDANDPELLNSREYLYIHDLEYNPDSPSPDVAEQSGGIAFANMYYFWPILAAGQEWNPSELENSILRILYDSKSVAVANATAVYDAYGGFGRQNINNLHPDHHHFTLIPMDESTETFMIVNGNDGGLGISRNNGGTFQQIENGYITSQFYGADKAPGADKYVGGTQDNGTWLSTTGTVNETSDYQFVLGGDGFEVVWHPDNENLVLATIYNNRIFKSTDGGNSFTASSSGIGEEDGPFITRLASSKTSPNTVYAIGNLGVYRSTNFGDTWSMRLISDDSWGGNASASDVTVSLANDQIVWAGAGMADGALNLFVSTNGGRSYEKTNNYSPDPNAFFTGIYTHPVEDSTAYALFSLPNFPKILKTTDLGKTWTDISGFEGSESGSNNGFPDAYVHSLLVMPFDTDIIWAGTEIGLFESLDGGNSWNFKADMPSVSIWSMKVVDNQVVLGTHGRGIWTAEIDELSLAALEIEDFTYNGYGKADVTFDLKRSYDKITLLYNDTEYLVLDNVAAGIRSVSIEGINEFNNSNIRLLAELNNEMFYAPKFNIETIDVTPDILGFSVSNNDGIYPVTIEVENNEPFEKVEVLFNSQVVHIDERILTEEDGNRIITFDYDQAARNNLQVKAFLNGQEYVASAQEQLITSNNNQLDTEFNIYPNPVNDIINISKANNISSLKIYSSKGVLVKQINISDLNQIDVSDLKQGIYLFQMSDAKGKLFTRRIIKQ